MAIFQKDLIGKHALVGSVAGNQYYFSLPTTPAGSQLPNQIDNQVIEEVYISADTTLGDIDLYLPAISTFNLAWNAKIYVICTNVDNTFRILPYTTEGSGSDTLNGFTAITATAAYDAWYLHIVQENMWMALKCAGPAI